MVDIGDIWDDDEDLARFGNEPPQKGRLCRDIFDSNADGFISGISAKIAKMKSVRASTRPGGDYWYTIDRYIKMLESAKIAAKAHRDISIRDDAP